jgi:hypothetical protein
LQEWNWNKKGERVSKVVLLGKDPKGLSAIEPFKYANRFRKFVNSEVLRL